MPPALELRALYFLLFLYVGGMGNYLSLWLEGVGWSETEIGWLNGVSMACKIGFPPLWGYLADRGGRPVRALLWITVGSALAWAPFVLTTAFVPLLAAMTAFSAFRVGIVPAADALTLSYLDEAGGDYGRVRLWGSVGFIVGGLVLGWIVAQTSRGAVPGALALVLVATGVLVALMPERLGARNPDHLSLGRAFRALLADRQLAYFFLVTFVARVASDGLFVFLPLHLHDLGVADSMVSVFWSVGVLSEIVLLRFAGTLFARWQPRRLISFCYAVAIVQYLLAATITDSRALLPVMLLHGVTFGVWYYASIAWLRARVPRAHRTLAQAIFVALGFGLGGTISAVAAGYIFAAGAGPLLFTVAAGAAALTTLLSLGQGRAGSLTPANTAPGS